MGKNKDIREAVEAELDFDSLVNAVGVTGVVLFARPGVGAVTLALLFGLFSIIYGISQIVLGVELHRTGHTADKILEQVV